MEIGTIRFVTFTVVVFGWATYVFKRAEDFEIHLSWLPRGEADCIKRMKDNHT